jgi:uncharacterized protein (DUF2236 family)
VPVWSRHAGIRAGRAVIVIGVSTLAESPGSDRVLPSEDEYPELVPKPGSITWRKASDIRLSGGSGYALLLQVSHPTVGAGVAQFSEYQSDPWGRLMRTLDYVHGTIYGGPELAGEIGRRVRAMHRRFKGMREDGRRYSALEPDAYAWVHATLAMSIVEGHRLFGTPFTPVEEIEFWDEWRRVGRLVGVRYRDLPEHWADLRPYFDHTVEHELENTQAVQDLLRSLGQPTPPPGLPAPAWRVAGPALAAQSHLVTTGMLPPILRERFGLGWSRAQEAAFRALGAASRASGPLLPRQLREMGPLHVRSRRRALARSYDAAPAAL